jgi:hypothetical protein
MVDKILASRGRKRFRKKRTRKKVGGKPKYGYKNCPNNDAVLDNSNDRMYPVPTSGNKKKLMDCDPMDRRCVNVRKGARGTKWGEGTYSGVANCDGGQAWYDHTYTKYQKNNSKTYALRLKKFYDAMNNKEWFTKYDSWWRSTLADGHQKKPSNSKIGIFGREVTKDVEDGFNPEATKEEQKNWKYKEHLDRSYMFPTSVKAKYTVNGCKEGKANYLDDYVEMMGNLGYNVTVKVPDITVTELAQEQSGGDLLLDLLKKAQKKVQKKREQVQKLVKKTVQSKKNKNGPEETNVSTTKIVVKPESMELGKKTITEYYEEILKKVKPMFSYRKGGDFETEDTDVWEKKRDEMREKKADLSKKMGEIFWDKFEIIVEEKPKGGGKVRKSKKRKSRRKKRKETRRKSRRRRR